MNWHEMIQSNVNKEDNDMLTEEEVHAIKLGDKLYKRQDEYIVRAITPYTVNGKQTFTYLVQHGEEKPNNLSVLSVQAMFRKGGPKFSARVKEELRRALPQGTSVAHVLYALEKPETKEDIGWHFRVQKTDTHLIVATSTPDEMFDLGWLVNKKGTSSKYRHNSGTAAKQEAIRLAIKTGECFDVYAPALRITAIRIQD